MSAAVLVQILENAQRAFELIGVHVEGRGIKERARVSPATSQRFQLVCQLPESGSYAMPVTVGGAGELFVAELAGKAFGIFRGVMEHVSARSTLGLATSCPMNASAAACWKPSKAWRPGQMPNGN